MSMTAAQISAFLARDFPQLAEDGGGFALESAGPMASRLRMPYHPRHLRPGGTISGPAMFALADVCLYVAILAEIGEVGLAVTTSLNINFLAKPGAADMVGECRLLKLGKRLAVGEVALYSEGRADMVAHATGTYSIPPAPLAPRGAGA